MTKTDNIEFIDPKVEQAEYKKPSLKDLIDGSFLARKSFAKQLPFILFLGLLAAIYIGNRYHAEKIIRETTRLQHEDMDLRAEAITSASELMFISKQTEVARMVKAAHLDLKESVTPPIRIKK